MNEPHDAWHAVLFDMDGVLIDSFDAWIEVLRECRLRRRLAPLAVEEVRAQWGQGIARDCETWFPGETPAVLAREYDVAFQRHVTRVRPVAGASECVATLRERGMRLAVVTNSPQAMTRAVLRAVGIDRQFDALATGDEVVRGKPDPALVELALARLDVDATQAVMIGDTHLDVAAARAAGVHVIGLGIDGDQRIEQMSDLISRLNLPPLRG